MHSKTNSCPKCNFSLASYESSSFCPECSFPNKKLQNRYQLSVDMGSGGFGSIYLANDTKNKTHVVVKFIRKDLFEKKNANEFVRRFQREIDVTKSLSKKCPHIVQVLNAGNDDVLGPYYVMEFLEGQTLEQILKENKELSFDFVYKVFSQLSFALHCAHSDSIIHRDLKPSNLFITKKQGKVFVKVIDFGITKVVTDVSESFQTQGLLGTPKYMSPEQCQGRELSNASDIYSAGCLLYEMLTGTAPFINENPSIMLVEHITKKPESIQIRTPGKIFPKNVTEIVQKSLEKKPEERYPTILDMENELRHAMGGLVAFSTIREKDQTVDIPKYPLYTDHENSDAFFSVEELDAMSSSQHSLSIQSSRFVPFLLIVLLPVLGILGIVWFLGKANSLVHKKKDTPLSKISNQETSSKIFIRNSNE